MALEFHDELRKKIPSYLSPQCKFSLGVRKFYRQTTTRFQEFLDRDKIDRGELLLKTHSHSIVADHPSKKNPEGMRINKSGKDFLEDLREERTQTISQEILSLNKELNQRGLRYVNAAGNFLSWLYDPNFQESNKMWEYCWMIRHSKIKSPAKILDVGGASTLFSFYLASKGCEVAIIDNDWANCGSIGNAKYVAQKMNWKLQAFDRCASRPFPFPDNAFDFIFSICTIEHLSKATRQHMMKEIGRLIKPQGIVGLTMDYDDAREIKLAGTDKGLRFSHFLKIKEQILMPSGLKIYGNSGLIDNMPQQSFIGALFLTK